MNDSEIENSNGHMLESNASQSASSESGSDAESTSSSAKTNSQSGQEEIELSVQYDPTKGNVVFTNNLKEEKETNSTSCDYCAVLDKENENCIKRIRELEERCGKLEHFNNDLNTKLELVSFVFTLRNGIKTFPLGFATERIGYQRKGSDGD